MNRIIPANTWTKSQAVRAAIRALTRPPAEDPILGLSGMLDGLPDDVSGNFDRCLDETYVAARPAPYRTRRRRRARSARPPRPCSDRRFLTGEPARTDEVLPHPLDLGLRAEQGLLEW